MSAAFGLAALLDAATLLLVIVVFRGAPGGAAAVGGVPAGRQPDRVPATLADPDAGSPRP